MSEPDYEADALRVQRDELKNAVTSLAHEKMKLRQQCEKLEKDVEFLRESRHQLILKLERIVVDALEMAVHVKMDIAFNKRKLKVHDGELDEDEDDE